jgi:hypothetical protein
MAVVRREFVEGCAFYAGAIDSAEGFRINKADGAHLEKAAREIQHILGDGDARVSPPPSVRHLDQRIHVSHRNRVLHAKNTGANLRVSVPPWPVSGWQTLPIT